MMAIERGSNVVVLNAISDPYTRRILASATEAAKSIEALSEENGIPISTCYRRVHELVKDHLLRIEHTTITPEGKRYQTFRSVFNTMEVTLCCGEVVIDLKLNPKEPTGDLHCISQTTQRVVEKELAVTCIS